MTDQFYQVIYMINNDRSTY